MCLLAVTSAFVLTSCGETDNTYDPHYDWKSRNAIWYETIADSARTAIAKARAIHKDAWREHTEWLMIRSLQCVGDAKGPLTDSICVHIIKRGTGLTSPKSNDTVRVAYRGFLMPTQMPVDGTRTELRQEIFDQSYYGPYDPKTVAPIAMEPQYMVNGFATALQYMVEGDHWIVYIPQQLAYGSTPKGTVPAFSTLQFDLHLIKWYESGSGVPAWR